jgi:activator of 2-hydroxyglutaryl-CoA dehydratase
MKAHLIFILIGMFLITTSCEDDDHEHDEEHTDADGFVLEDENGSEVYREFEGAIEGSVSLSVGDTLVLSVHFLDHDGNEIEHEEEDELVVSENDANIAIVEVEEHEEDEEEHHGAGLHVIGVSAGSTNFKLQLMHDGHADYTSTNNVPVVVN